MADTLAGAFFNDPVWAWAFPDPAQRHEQHAALWGLLLESTNPANLDRYRSVGFEPIGDLDLPHGGPAVTRMWRDAR